MAPRFSRFDEPNNPWLFTELQRLGSQLNMVEDPLFLGSPVVPFCLFVVAFARLPYKVEGILIEILLLGYQGLYNLPLGCSPSGDIMAPLRLISSLPRPCVDLSLHRTCTWRVGGLRK